MGQKLLMKEFLVVSLPCFCAWKAIRIQFGKKTTGSLKSFRDVVDAVHQPKLGMSFCWAQGSD